MKNEFRYADTRDAAHDSPPLPSPVFPIRSVALSRATRYLEPPLLLSSQARDVKLVERGIGQGPLLSLFPEDGGISSPPPPTPLSIIVIEGKRNRKQSIMVSSMRRRLFFGDPPMDVCHGKHR